MMKTISLSTEPISLNLMYRGRRFLTKRGKDTKEAMEWEFQSQWKRDIIEGDVTLNVIFYFKNNRRRDIDSHLKAVLDSMSGIVYVDDSQVNELHVFKCIDTENPRVVVQVV